LSSSVGESDSQNISVGTWPGTIIPL
jgi:hypothetical protein